MSDNVSADNGVGLKRSLDSAFSLGWYFRLFRSHWMLPSQMVIASILVQLFALGLPVFYLIIFDRVFGRQNMATLDIIGIGVLVVLTFDLLVKMLRTYLMSHQLEWLDKITVGLCLDKLFPEKLGQLENQKEQAFSDQFPELVKLNANAVNMVLVTSLDAGFSMILAAILFGLNPLLASVALCPLIPIVLYSYWNTPHTKSRAVRFQKEQRRCQLQLAEVVQNRETLQSLNASAYKRKELAHRISRFIEEGFDCRRDQLGSGNIPGFFINLGSMLTLYVGAKIVLHGDITYGVYIAINMMSRVVLSSFQKLLTAHLQLQDSANASQTLKDLVLSTSEESTRKTSAAITPVYLHKCSGRLHLENVRFRYSAETPWVLDGLSLDTSPGERVVITGRSGCGKTTLTRLLQKLYDPSGGYLTLDGYNYADLETENLRGLVGVAQQKPAMFTGTVYENIALAKPEATTQEITDAASIAMLGDLLFESAEGLNTQVNPMGLNLSGGQIQRIALARLFLAKSSLLILDEALTSLPPAMKVNILNNIQKHYREQTCIFIDHFIPLHQSVDRIIVIDNGQVVEQGHFKELVARKGPYQELYNLGVPAR